MELVICVSDFWLNKIYYRITPATKLAYNVNNKQIYKLEILQTKSKKWQKNKVPVVSRLIKGYKCHIDGINFFYLNKELLNFYEYRKVLTTGLTLKGVNFLQLQIIQPERDIIDWKWNRMLAATLWEKVEIEYLMSWLSTLGGAFSALGEQFSKCAEMAGKISYKQLMIGIKLGDPFLQSRCKLFYSISLIQMGRLRSAKYIIKEQYKFARCHEDIDGRLVKMCKGIWLKLQYEYGRRFEARKNEFLPMKPNNAVNK